MNLNVFSQVKIILDTDIGTAADDLGALTMLHFYTSKGDCELLAVMNSTIDKYAVSAIDAINRFYHHAEIPVGTRKDGAELFENNYNREIAENFPHQLTYDNAPDATQLYRQILSKAEDKSITLVVIGPLINIQQLLLSRPDSFSGLNGTELLHQKVKEVVIMGGIFPEGKNEYNFKGEQNGVTRFVIQNLKMPVVFTGFEVGEVIKTGEILNNLEKNTPLYRGFLFSNSHAPWTKQYFKGKIIPTSSFDQTAVLYAVKGGVGKYWEKISDGFCEIDENGDNRWIQGKASNQSYLKLVKPGEEIAKVIEAAMLHEEK
jgi:inosine-uridine nucleoside N-ribohydrolase